MNIGIDFNIKTTKATYLDEFSSANDIFIEIENLLVFSNGNIFIGKEGLNKFLTEKDSELYDLDQIIECNGLIINKQQVSPKKCLSVIFANLLSKIKLQTPNIEIDFVCISIPYDKYYYWHDLITDAFSLIGVQKLRIISQPAAFFAQSNIKSILHNLDVLRYESLLWHKKALTKNPNLDPFTGYLFISLSQDNTNISLVNYSDDVFEAINTQYTNIVTREIIVNAIFDFFVSMILEDPQGFALDDKKTKIRILEAADFFLKESKSGNISEINLPYLLCKDGGYKNLDLKVDLNILETFLAPIYKNLINVIKELADKTQLEQTIYINYPITKIGNIIVVGDSYVTY